MQVQLVNRVDAPTNLHVHGLYVSPEGSGGNVFVAVASEDLFDYDQQDVESVQLAAMRLLVSGRTIAVRGLPRNDAFPRPLPRRAP